MGDSKIEWTDATWNAVRGCTKISPGCKNCYASTFAERWRGVPGHAYEQGFDLRLVPEKLEEPLHWKKPRRIFVNSMSDLFQEGVPFEFVDKVFAVMALSPQHTFQVLTKRAERMREYFESDGIAEAYYRGEACAEWLYSIGRGSNADIDAVCAIHNTPNGVHAFAPNVHLGVSVENQQYADERIPLLLQTPAAKRFVSYEPALGAVDFCSVNVDRGLMANVLIRYNDHPFGSMLTPDARIDWIIVGGESGPGARPFNVQWARDIVQQCKASGVACFVKQLGSNVHTDDSWEDDGIAALTDDCFGGFKVHLSGYKGCDPAEWPEDLRVREFPQ